MYLNLKIEENWRFFTYFILSLFLVSDVNECNENPCAEGEYCVNMAGSHKCKGIHFIYQVLTDRVLRMLGLIFKLIWNSSDRMDM